MPRSSPAQPTSGCGSPRCSRRWKKSFTSAVSPGLPASTRARRLHLRRVRFAGARRAGLGIDRSRHRRSAAAVRVLQVRAAGTVGGNIANGSPIGDLAPMLIALRARVELRRDDHVRELAAGELLSRLRQAGSTAGRIRAPPAGAEAFRPPTHFRAYKITKRTDEDISGGACGVLPQRRRRPHRRRDRRFRRHGGDPETRESGRRKPARAVACRCEPLAAGRRGRRQRLHAADRSARQRRYRGRVAANLVVKAIAEMAGVGAGVTRIRTTGSFADAADDAVLEAPLRHVYKPLPHDSGAKHVQGNAEYIDDIPEPVGTLHLAVGGAPVARGTLRACRSRRRAQRARRRRGHDRSRHTGKERHFTRQRRRAGLRAGPRRFPSTAGLRRHRYVARCRAPRGASRPDRGRRRKPNVSVEQGRASGEVVLPDYGFINGDAAKAIAASPRQSAGTIRIGGQEHFYLEGQIGFAVPGEDGAVLVYSSTQHPSEVQHVVARVLGMPDSFVTCRVRRMGGGFGGKETQATQWAVIAALAARVTGRPCKLRLDRDADMAMTGKRHDFAVEYAVGYEPDGRIRAVNLDLDARCGCSADVSIGVVDRAMFHSDNAYFLAGIQNPFAPDQDQYGVEYRLPRLRRPAGNAGDRARDRHDRLESRPRSARRAQNQPLQPRPRRHALRANRRRPRCGAAAARPARTLVQLPPAAQRDQRVQRTLSDSEKRHRADAGEIRNFVHADASQSGRRAGARLSGRLCSPQSRRHRNGPGPVSESGAGGGRRIRHRARARAHHGHLDRQGAEHVGHGGVLRHRSQRDGGAAGDARNQVAADAASPARPGTSPKIISPSATIAYSSATRAFRSAN